MLGFIWWLIIGFVAGLLARFLMPGQQPMTWIMTIVLGVPLRTGKGKLSIDQLVSASLISWECKSLYWNIISKHPNIKMEDIINNPELPWNFCNSFDRSVYIPNN